MVQAIRDIISYITIAGGVTNFPDQTGHAGDVLSTDGTLTSWITPGAASLPSQGGHAGEFLGTDGTDASWQAVSMLAGKTLRVDSVNGSDGTGTRGNVGKPYLTLAAARTASQAGDVIHVGPGSYAEVTLLANTSLHATPETTFTNVGDVPLFSDAGGARATSVTGKPTINSIVSNPVISMANDSSKFDGDFLDITCGSTGSGLYMVSQTAGDLTIRARNIDAGDNGFLWWENGECHVYADTITGGSGQNYTAIDISASDIVTMTGDLHVHAGTISAPGNPLGSIANSGGVNTEARAWIRANVIKDGIGFGGCLLYVESEKVKGTVQSLIDDGQFYLTTQKLNGQYQHTTTTSSWINADVLDDTDLGAVAVVSVSSGDVTIRGMTFVSSGTSLGILVSGGTLRLVNCVIDTSANSGTNPVTVSGGTLILDGCTLIANAAVDSIYATTSQSVAIGGTLTVNRPVNANVTLTGGMKVRSDTGIVTLADGTVIGAGGGSSWGSITGTLSNQTDLQTALTGKQTADADLTAIAALTTTSFGRGLLTTVNAAGLATTAGLGTSDAPTLAGLTLTGDINSNSNGIFLGISATAAVQATGTISGSNLNLFTTFSAPSKARTYTLPDATCTILTNNAAVTVAQGGTGIAAGTSGGIPYFSGSTTITSSSALTANALMIGGGTGSAPSTTTTGTGVLSVLALPADGSDVDAIGTRGVPQASKSADYTLVMADAGKMIYHPSTDNNARTFTIPANGSVAYEIGTIVSFFNDAATSCTVAITTDVLAKAGSGTTGSVTLPQYGLMTAQKVTSTRWIYTLVNS